MVEFLLKHSEIINLLAGIGTFISALIALFTLLEVKKQRLSMYKPEILIKSFILSISKSPLLKKEELLEYRVIDFNDNSNNYYQTKLEPSPNYKLDNFGFGIAKNIVCKWEFESDIAIEMIKKIFPNNYTFRTISELNIYFLKKLDNEEFHFSINSDIDNQTIDFIAPINQQKHYHFHAIPSVIIYTHYLFLIFKKDLLTENCANFRFFEFENFPRPILKIEYSDINNKKYKKTFKFRITAVSNQVDDILDMGKEFCYLHFELK
ncbi:MAG: hypothetical protein IT236_14965 [Bacteroidia bacterium]|nr:hypothetical protein [Bacteroidia bacterium]